MELKENRAVMNKAPADSNVSWFVNFNLNGAMYTIALYPNVDKNERIYYGGAVTNYKERNDERGE